MQDGTPFFSADQMTEQSNDKTRSCRGCSIPRLLVTLMILCSFVFVVHLIIKNGLKEEEVAPIDAVLTEYKGCNEIAVD